MSLNQKQAKERIEKWLQEEGRKVIPKTEKNTIFSLESQYPNGLALYVVQPSASIDGILIMVDLGIDTETQNKLKSLSKSEQTDILWKVRFGLLNLNVEFDGVSIPLKKIRITKSIYYDGLTKNTFLDVYSTVMRAFLFVSWTLDSAFGKIQPNQSFQYID